MILDKRQQEETFNELRYRKEKEWFEFKEAKNDYSFDDLGKYFSAISNEANLKRIQYGWIIFGIDNNGKIVGTNYKNSPESLDKLKKDVADHTGDRLTFIEIYELSLQEGRVIMFQIPAAPSGIPTSWKGHYYGRENDSLAPLNIQELEYIRNQKYSDWSARIYEKVTLKDLDPIALGKARENFREKNPKISSEVDEWDDETFLNKINITIEGKITATAIILLGKEETQKYLNPFTSQITWILEDNQGNRIDYEHFGPPFILSVEKVFSKIRNLTYRYIPGNTLFPVETQQYEPYIIREALHNCIAHQDYTLRGRINVIEKPDRLFFINEGTFIPGNIETLFSPGYVPPFYRNFFLANAMVRLNMIDTISSGIHRMFRLQRKRYFPLPDYDLTEPSRVFVTIYGTVLDENYTRALINNTDLSSGAVMLLDKVQKRKSITKDEYNTLKKQKLVEGRYPNIYVASQIADITGDKTSYIKYRAFDNSYYKDMILELITEYGFASKKEIAELLKDKISDILDEKQKFNKIRNIIQLMSRKDKTIKNTGTNRNPKWILNL
ncbi:MAG: RNA-binding domain-containing protein [Candidatus Eremiobacterota bacterium]